MLQNSVSKVSRGVRNNNPGNIRRGSSRWRGLSAVQSDKEFCQFDDMVYGVRAFLCLLRTYVKKYGVRSVRSFVHRYAPAADGNNEVNYVNCVVSDLNGSCFLGALPSDCVLSADMFVCPRGCRPCEFHEVLYVFASSVFFVESCYVLPRYEFDNAYRMM